jgi:hypothetical protein
MKKSYIVSDYKVSKTTYQFVQNKIHGLGAEQQRFFLHLLCSQLIAVGRDDHEDLAGWDTLGLKLPYKTIKAEFERGFSWKPLKSAGLIEASDYCDGQCRYFQVSPNVFQEILDHLGQQIQAPDGAPAVNLFDGTAYGVACRLSGEHAPPSSKVMRDALRILHVAECPFNVSAIQDHLDWMLRHAKTLAFDNDLLCAQGIFAGMKTGSGAVALYVPSYCPQSSGRIGECGGGLQSCSRLMKQAAFDGVPNLFNYDLRSSQGYVLLQELQLAGMDDTWLASHLGPGAFEERAAQLGLNKKIYKRLFFATIMGATHQWLDGEHVGSIQASLQRLHGDDVDAARAAFNRVVAQLAPLKQTVRQWAQWLLESPDCPHHKGTQRRDYLENAAGQALVFDGSVEPRELRRKAAAHILQGQESAYIHHLTVLSKSFDFAPVSNQHDGLITLDSIPDEAQRMAAELSGFRHAYLELKPFV